MAANDLLTGHPKATELREQIEIKPGSSENLGHSP
jgi:hypothetical protein